MNAIPRHRGLADMCCCRWNHDLGMRLETHSECSVHGWRAQVEAPRKALELKRLTAQMAVSSARLEALTWIRRHRASKRKLAAINRKLKEMGA